MSDRIILLLLSMFFAVLNGVVYSVTGAGGNLWASGMWTGILIYNAIDFYHNDWKNRNRR